MKPHFRICRSTSYERPVRGNSLTVHRLNEPQVLFRDRNALSDVREGITRFGSFDNDAHTVEIVPFCLDQFKTKMESLIHRLMEGKFKYRGSERTFSTRFTYRSVITASAAEGIDSEVSRILTTTTRLESVIDNLNRIFLVQSPEAGYSSDDESSPYYVVKRRLLEAGVPMPDD